MRTVIYLVLSTVLLIGLFVPFGSGPRYGNLLVYPMSPLVMERDSGLHLERDLPFEGELWIGYDALGIPHIQCNDEKTAAFAIGYLHAHDRLFQIEMMRRQVLGRLSEVAGKRAMVVDRFWRKFRFEDQCKAIYAQEKEAGSSTYQAYTAYADGVNAWLDQMDDRELPLEFRLIDFKPMRFEPWHCLLLNKAMAFDLSYLEDDLEFSHIQEELSDELIEFYYPWVSPRSFPVYPNLKLTDSMVNAVPAHQDIYTTGTTFRDGRFFQGENYNIGSNNWAVGPKKSSTGNPFLCNDTHLKLRLPSIFYEVVVTTSDNKRRGFTIPGAPMILLGFNEYIAWGETNATWDLVDFYRLDMNEQGDGYYLDGQEMKLEPFTETFRVKGDHDVEIKFHHTPFGPLDTVYGEVLATGWPAAMISSNDGEAFYNLQQAHSVEEAKKGLEPFKVPAQNFVLIDREGHIGLVTAGMAARHKTRQRGIIHARSIDDRMALFPTNDLLQETDPERGWVSSANQNHIAGDAGALLSYRFAPTSRSRRIAELLSDSVPIGRDYLARMQMDVVDGEWRLMRERFLDHCPEEWCTYLENWDGSCTIDEVAPTLFVAFRRNLVSIFSERLSPGIALDPQEEHMVWLVSEQDTLPLKEGYILTNDLMKETFEATKKELTAFFQKPLAEWHYGGYHQLLIPHIAGIEPLGFAPYPAIGSGRTINVAGGFPTTFGPAMRTLIEMTPEGPKGWLMITGGQSGKISSTNYADQVKDFRNGTYHEAPLMDAFDKNNFIRTIHFTHP